MSRHPISHMEIPAANSAEVSEFYQAVFGWKVETNVEHNYQLFQAEGGLRGGFAAPTEPTYQAGRPLVYFATDDIEATLAAIEAHGGKTVIPRTEIPHVVAWALFADPAGNVFGLAKRLA